MWDIRNEKNSRLVTGKNLHWGDAILDRIASTLFKTSVQEIGSKKIKNYTKFSLKHK